MPEIDIDKIYKQLKKQNGEGVARVIRDAVLLDVPNIVHILEFAGNNPDEVKQLVPVIREIYKTQQESQYHTDKNPLELLNDAGYDAFVVDSLEKQNSIKKYFRPGEELCTFRDSARYKNYYMIHAVKRGAENIKPATNPEREDEYGTSVISIQIAKTGGFISIKNRYNHTVNDPDATFNNNPDKIIHGLTDSLKKFFHVDFNTSENPLPYNFRMVNDQLVRYNHEINNVYFGPDYYFSGSTITRLNNDNQILINPDILLTISRGNNSVVSVVGEAKDLCDELNEYVRDKKVSVSVRADKTKSILVNGQRCIDVKNGTLTYIYMPQIKKLELGVERAAFIGDLDFSGVESLGLYDCLDNVTDIKLNPKAKKIRLHGGKLSGKLDLSGVDELELEKVDMTNVTDIKLNPKAKKITLHCGKLSGKLDLSGVDELELKKVDMTNVTDIKLNPKAKKITLHGVKLSGKVDLSGVCEVKLWGCDLSGVTNINLNPNAESIGLGYVKGLAGNFDFSGVRHLSIMNTDLNGKNNIKFNPNAVSISLIDCGKVSGDLDFSGVQYHLFLEGVDLTGATNIKLNPNLAQIRLHEVKLSGDLDFSNMKCIVDLENADLSDVKSIKLSSYLYKQIKKYNFISFKCIFKGKEMQIRDLPKYGVVIKKPNVFVNGKKKLREKMQRLVQSVSHNANDK